MGREKIMKKALIYDPYIDTLGGGERYVLTFALGLIQNGYSVVLAWPAKNDLLAAETRFGLDLSKITLDQGIYDLCSQKTDYAERLKFTKDFDLIFWVSDGSLPFLFSKNNLIHFQVPFKKLGSNSIINNLKTVFVRKFVYNSEFTRNVLEKNLQKDKGFVLYPPIDTESFKSGKKENLILSVARFDSPSHSKRQDALIESFKILSGKTKGYKLILAGGLIGDEATIKKLKNLAKGLSVEFITNPDFNELKKLYSQAKFFWHAAGYEINEQTDPEKVEHFGMATVEAMSAGCIPLVINKGGQKEIITENSGVLCNTPDEIASATQHLIKNLQALEAMSKGAIARAKTFSISEFNKKLTSLL
ncbi:MAG: Glycosyl transferase family 2 [Candidatus Collierbacteria bacterium GW2011_GWB1_45_35]|uniref:Glycosyl transferase family 2 n=1 Tax=Candidatus Collierbacteria bacterium GW2011_GWB2_45_17 TaxID=1618388 RepID=A0A837IEK5_9BACT|nr:MAG: Glycosyl transferase family 2 [Microgenomates group bacterium GW2011_GWC1_44_23]KKT95816.1 MAG: Glycosyl transferase family 2 [Candidatus Collierbacteria bacterium GW2011_GWA1_45_15]KKU00240.1 MAG: Glycosyl transferase family 2 [Candidatus Collierbacteria bacterium GW2011_GWB2_45_17]KKU05440.1 MAG: Glycosyl transferase family 2 [Candidatus Collierbacteria bacterium GW2011_GWB1_45_35]KKU08670.1 MAG: Glycosyl transferase family 2 [Candidatus Collierbacteria bacterium GW2011_GWC2_45_40]